MYMLYRVPSTIGLRTPGSEAVYSPQLQSRFFELQQPLSTLSWRALAARLRRRSKTLGVLAMVCGAALGCGSGSVTHAGSISITDPTGAVTGQLTSLPVTAAATVSMMPINDPKNAGVDWVVTCGGSPL